MNSRLRSSALTSRKGGIFDMSWETIIKLVLYGLILVALYFMTMKLISIFSHGEEDWRAQRNFQVLGEAIKHAREDGQASVVLNLPESTVILGFDESMPVGEEIQFEKSLAPTPSNWISDVFNIALFGGTYLKPNVNVKRPDCGDVCICAYRVSSGLNWGAITEIDVTSTEDQRDKIIKAESEPIACGLVKDAHSIRGEWEYVQWRQDDAGADYIHTVRSPEHAGARMVAIGGNVGIAEVTITYDESTGSLDLFTCKEDDKRPACQPLTPLTT